MVAPNLRRVEATVSRDRVALASPAFLFVKPAAVAPVQSAIRFIQQLDAGKPLRILFAVETGHDKPQRKTMPLRQRLAVHFVSDERGRLHRLCKPKRLVVAVGRTKENGGDVGLRLYLREQCRQPHAFPNGVRTKAAPYSVGNTKQRRFLLDRWH